MITDYGSRTPPRFEDLAFSGVVAIGPDTPTTRFVCCVVARAATQFHHGTQTKGSARSRVPLATRFAAKRVREAGGDYLVDN